MLRTRTAVWALLAAVLVISSTTLGATTIVSPGGGVIDYDSSPTFGVGASRQRTIESDTWNPGTLYVKGTPDAGQSPQQGAVNVPSSILAANPLYPDVASYSMPATTGPRTRAPVLPMAAPDKPVPGLMADGWRQPWAVADLLADGVSRARNEDLDRREHAGPEGAPWGAFHMLMWAPAGDRGVGAFAPHSSRPSRPSRRWCRSVGCPRVSGGCGRRLVSLAVEAMRVAQAPEPFPTAREARARREDADAAAVREALEAGPLALGELAFAARRRLEGVRVAAAVLEHRGIVRRLPDGRFALTGSGGTRGRNP